MLPGLSRPQMCCAAHAQLCDSCICCTVEVIIDSRCVLSAQIIALAVRGTH